jgi:hypothetical protein
MGNQELERTSYIGKIWRNPMFTVFIRIFIDIGHFCQWQKVDCVRWTEGILKKNLKMSISLKLIQGFLAENCSL